MTDNAIISKKPLLILAVTFYLILVSVQIGKPFIADEAEFVEMSANLYKNGTSSFGNCAITQNLTAIDTAHGLWHPPLYVHMLSLVYYVLEVSEVSSRFLGIICAIISALLVYRIADRFLQLGRWSVLAAVMTITSPIAIQGSIIVDIDNTILTTLNLLFIYAVLWMNEKNQWNMRGIFCLSIILSACFWTKILTQLLMLASLFIFLLLQKGLRDAIRRMILLCSFTLILLASSWMAYSYLHQLSDCQTLYPFIHLYKTFKGQTDYSSSFTLLAKRTLTVVGWFFPQVLLLAAVGAYHRLKDFAVNRKAEPIDFLILYIAVVYATYSISAPPWGFPRYQYPLMGALCILAVASLKRLNSELLPTARLIAISAVVLAYYLMLGDPFLVYYTMKETLLENPGDTLGVYAKMLIQPLLFILPSILLFALFKIGRRMDAIKAITLSLIIPAIMAGIAVDLVQAKADYNTTYLYGETGEAGVVAYLHTIAPSSRVLCQSKEIAFYLRGMDVSVNLDEKMLESRAKTVTLIGRENPDYIVIRAIRSAEDYSTTNDPEVKELLDSRYSKHLFGSFIVYERRTI